MGIQFDSSKGQHLLINEDVLKKEISVAKIKDSDKVIEIGAGAGMLTKELVKKSGKVLAFEIDEKFKKYLDELSGVNKNLRIVYGDALKVDWRGYDKIVSNIPYVLSEPIVSKAIIDGIDELVLIVGAKFKDLLSSEKFEHSRIGVIASLFYDFEAILKVDKKDFNPVPSVNSWLIRLVRKKKVSKIDSILQSVVVRKGKIKNSIMYGLVNEGKTKREAREIIAGTKIPLEILDKPVKMMTGKFILRLKDDLVGI